VATNGFEVGVPTLRREMLGIPRDAIVYFSAQTGYKRNPANIRSQLEILKAVPNSYFLIKGFYCDLNALQNFFQDLVDQVGVEYDRLRFLDTVKGLAGSEHPAGLFGNRWPILAPLHQAHSNLRGRHLFPHFALTARNWAFQRPARLR
jgi:hypothetical protein